MDSDEFSESGQPIYRHQPREKPWEPADLSGSSLEAISDHIERHIGKIDSVFHEIASDLVHVDVHFVPPGPGRDYVTLVTSGMSDRPMTVPQGAEAWRFAELLINLPPRWPLRQQDFQDENNYWPIRWLKMLARFPHEYDTWLGYGHTVPNGDPPAPFASRTAFAGMLLELPLSAGEDFSRLEIDDQKTIYFYALVPLYAEEMALKLKKGTQHLENLFDKHHIGDVVDVGRINVAKRKLFGIF
jgi:hypothetical protein